MATIHIDLAKKIKPTPPSSRAQSGAKCTISLNTKKISRLSRMLGIMNANFRSINLNGLCC